jgi:hypothetical protein
MVEFFGMNEMNFLDGRMNFFNRTYAWEILIIFCAEEFNNFGENSKGVNYSNHINIKKRKEKRNGKMMASNLWL